ncbi:MAG: head-tail adaptor protein [Promicromonosporaceae bacterium]|nr:head-tail adaptor protein [Promicromonosporaceae bacterium]
MSFGKLNTQIEVVAPGRVLDHSGFAVGNGSGSAAGSGIGNQGGAGSGGGSGVVVGDQVLATVRAAMSDGAVGRRSGERMVNQAALATSQVTFRFRAIPGVVVTPALAILCGGKRYRIVTATDVAGRGRYWEVTAELAEKSVW